MSWTPPTASDNSGTVSLTSTHQPGDAFFIGVTNITYTAVDSYSNQATLVITIIVTGECSFSLSDVSPGVIIGRGDNSQLFISPPLKYEGDCTMSWMTNELKSIHRNPPVQGV